MHPGKFTWRRVAPRIAALLFLGLASCGPPGTPQRDIHRGPLDERETARIALGRKLFFEKELSRNRNVSCASCHQPSHGFSDPSPFSRGTHGDLQSRSTPGLLNVANRRLLFWDGREESLEKQALMPIQNPHEMDLSLEEVVERLTTDDEYPEHFRKVFPEKGVTAENLAASLASFVGSLVTQGSPYDAYLAGNEDALSPQARRGMTTFFGRGKCSRCHHGRDLTDGDFHNTGVVTEDLGRFQIVRSAPREGEMSPYPQFSNYKAFRTPSLRNVALSPPYMHNASQATLTDVVHFYNRGGDSEEKTGRSFFVEPLGLSESEVNDLVTFLESLTDPVNTPEGSPQ